MSEQYTLTVKAVKKQSHFLICKFEKPDGFSFSAGHYGVFKMLEPVEGRKVRAFSYVSAPEESTLTIATFLREPISSFKTAMMSLKKGDHVMMGGPMGVFQREPETPAVYIAGGIGITPFMSMIRTFKDDSQTLIYSSINGYLFEQELKEYSYLSTHFTGGVKNTQSVIKETLNKQPSAIYYLVGSSNFVKGVKGYLEDLGLDKAQIMTDSFSGY